MPIPCPDNCGECCGAIPFEAEFLEKHKDKIQRPIIESLPFAKTEIYPVTKGNACPFLRKEDMRCAIYEERPEICRRYGYDEDVLPCPHYDKDGNKRCRQSFRRVQRQINKNVDKFIDEGKRVYKL
jgi:hypothetical protein